MKNKLKHGSNKHKLQRESLLHWHIAPQVTIIRTKGTESLACALFGSFCHRVWRGAYYATIDYSLPPSLPHSELGKENLEEPERQGKKGD